MRRFVGFLAALSLFGITTRSLAQARSDQPSADLRGVYAPMHHEAGLAFEPADSPDTLEITGSARAWYAFRPVVLRGPDDEIAYRVVEHQFTADVGINIGILGRLTLGLDLPLLLGQIGDDVSGDPDAVRILGPEPIPITSLGDPGLRAKVTILKPIIEDGLYKGVALGIDERFTLPLGDERSFIAEGGVTSESRALLDIGLGVVSLHVDAGVKIRESTGYYACDPDVSLETCPSRFGIEVPAIAGIALHPKALGIDPENRGTLFVEAHGRIPVAPVTPDESTLPMSWYASIAGRYRAGDVALIGGVELGLGDGIGVAPFRAMLGVSFAPRQHDSDRDGMADDDDKCPLLAEDVDGTEDDDGCPEMDNDGDSVPDKMDQCPQLAGTAAAGCPS